MGTCPELASERTFKTVVTSWSVFKPAGLPFIKRLRRQYSLITTALLLQNTLRPRSTRYHSFTIMADPTTSAGYFHHRPRKVKANPKDLAPRGVVTPSILSPASSSLASLRDSTFDLSEPNIGRHLRSFPSSDTSLSAASEDETKRHIALRVDREDVSLTTILGHVLCLTVAAISEYRPDNR